MGAVALGRDETTSFLTPGVGIACENSPNSVTVSGDSEAVDSVLSRIKTEKPDALCKRLQVDTAYHSSKSFPRVTRYGTQVLKQRNFSPHARSRGEV